MSPKEVQALEMLWMRKGHGHWPRGEENELARQAWHKILQRVVEWANGQPMKGFEVRTLDELEGLLRKTVLKPWVNAVFEETRAAITRAEETA